MAESDLDQVLAVCRSPDVDHKEAKALQAEAERSGDIRMMVLGLIKAADALQQMNKLEDALTQVSEAKSLCQDLGTTADDCLAAAGLSSARIHLQQCDEGRDVQELDQAFDEASDALVTFKLMDHPRGQASAMSVLVSVYQAQKVFPKSIKIGKDALAMFRELDDRRSAAEVLLKLKDSHLLLKDPQKATQAVQKALEDFKALKDNKRHAECLGSLAEVMVAGKDWGGALEAGAAAQTAFKALKDHNGQAKVMATIASVHQDLGDTAAALEVAKDIVSIQHQARDKHGEAKALLSLCSMLIKTRERRECEQALKLAQSAEAISQTVFDKDGVKAAEKLQEEARTGMASAAIEAAINRHSDFINVPRTLIVDPGMGRKAQQAYTDFANAL